VGDQLKFITFLLAPIGYAGLTAVTVMAAQGQLSTALLRVTVAVIVVHVFMVWHVHYGWQLSEATRNGYVGFVLFHGALASIVASTMAPPHIARILLTAAFLVVTLGALAATAEYEVVRAYRIPVMVLAAVGLIGLVYRPVFALVRRFVG
jgi:hypothetical protein